MLTLKVNEMDLGYVLIHSGASFIDFEPWNSLKHKHIECKSKTSDRTSTFGQISSHPPQPTRWKVGLNARCFIWIPER